MNQSQLVSYFQSLHRDHLRISATYTVYSVPPDGHIKMHLQRLTAGTEIFADANGEAILLVKCGNPLTHGPELVFKNPALEANPGPENDELLQVDTTAENPSPDMLMSPPTISTPEVLAPETPEVSEQLPPVLPIFSGVGGAAAGGAGGGLGVLPILGGVIWGIGSGGGHGTVTPPAVPEPSAYVTMGLGLIGLGGLRRRRARNR